MKRRTTSQPAPPDPALVAARDQLLAQQSSSSPDQRQIVGDPRAEVRKNARRLWWIVGGYALLIAIILWLLGPNPNINILSLFQRIVAPTRPQFELIESRYGSVVILENLDEGTRIQVQVAKENHWRNISMDDFTVMHPILSLTGTKIAYLSKLGKPHIVVASLITDTRQSLDGLKGHPSLFVKDLPTTVCPWSPVRWSPSQSEDYLAFFVCEATSNSSYAVVANWTLDPPLIVWSEKNAIVTQDRDLVWLDSDHLIIRTNISDTGKATIETVPIEFP